MQLCRGRDATGYIQKQTSEASKACIQTCGTVVAYSYLDVPELSCCTLNTNFCLNGILGDQLSNFPERLKQLKLQFSVCTTPLFSMGHSLNGSLACGCMTMDLQDSIVHKDMEALFHTFVYFNTD